MVQDKEVIGEGIAKVGGALAIWGSLTTKGIDGNHFMVYQLYGD